MKFNIDVQGALSIGCVYRAVAVAMSDSGDGLFGLIHDT